MFSVGDIIVYGGMGVCTVEGIGVPDMPGANRECYVLKPHYVANSKVYAPVAANPVKMRRLLTIEQTQALIGDMPSIKAFPQSREKQEMHNTYRCVIKSADTFLLAKLLKTLYEKRRAPGAKRPMPSAEKEYFDTAQRMLFGEMAAVLQIPVGQVQGYIAARLDSPAPAFQPTAS